LNTVVPEVRPLADVPETAARVTRGGTRAPGAGIDFATPGFPSDIRTAGRRAGAAVAATRGEVTALPAAGLPIRSPDGGVGFPFDAVKPGFLLRAACPPLSPCPP